MASAFSSLVALEQLLHQLINSDTTNVFPREELTCLHGKISSLKSSLDKIFPAKKQERDKAKNLAIRIRTQIFEVQDTIESFILTQSHPTESHQSSTTQISLGEIMASIDPIIEEAKEMGDSIEEGPPPQGDAPQTFKSSSSGGRRTRIVGQEKYKAKIEKMLTADVTGREVIPISGAAGIGKTTLARSIYEDPKIKDQFQYRAWVSVSQDYNIGDILGKLLNSLESRGQKAGDKLIQGTEQLRVQIHQALHNNKYLVVIDDMWDEQIWLKLKLSLPDNENRSRVIITTRMLNVANAIGSIESLEMQPLNDIDSWELLCESTFGGGNDCPAQLLKLGRKIAVNCHGFPLSLVVIGGLLSQGKKTVEYWQTIAQDTDAATSDANLEDAYLGILSLSYDHLPSKLKGCFLYMGAFPEDCDIPVSKLVRLWVAEGFLTIPSPPKEEDARLWAAPSVEKVAEQSLLELINRNLVVIHRMKTNGRIKSCGMQKSLRDYAEKESRKDMFFHSRKRQNQKLEEGTSSQRRVSVHKNILICLQDVYSSTKKITNARSLLYVGPHHHHPIPYILTFDLLRVLDALAVFFIHFPNEFLKLVHLRYLSLTFNGKLPSRLSQLQMLQVLIVRRQPKFIFVGKSFLPDGIWNMKELRHLLITETDLPPLPASDHLILLENLQTLSNVNVDSCTEEVLEHMPSLKMLAVWKEGPGKCGLYLQKLQQLEIFKFTVLNYIPGKGIEFLPMLYLPNTLRKLCLSGCGLPWADMEVIAKLPNLQVMKLKEHAFHGHHWVTTYTFSKLKFLLIEYLDLKKWNAKPPQFPSLEQLVFRHCYELEEITLDITEMEKIKLLEVVDCSPATVELAEEVQAIEEKFGNEELQVHIYSSWE